jgi:tetratricopeptide (TPR) repeat protein
LCGAVAIIKDTERFVSAMDDACVSGELAWQWVILDLNAGEPHAARQKLAMLEEMSEAAQHANLHLAHSRRGISQLCSEGRYDEALAGLDGAVRRARARTSVGALIRLLALRAVALHARGRYESALSAARPERPKRHPPGLAPCASRIICPFKNQPWPMCFSASIPITRF